MKAAIISAITSAALTCGYNSGAEDIFVQFLGKMNVPSTNGYSSLEVFYVTNAAPPSSQFGLYWFAKPNTRQAVVAWSSNTVVDCGDRLCCFQQDPYETFVFPGFTNIDDPTSEAEIGARCRVIIDSTLALKAFPGIRSFAPQALVPFHTFQSGPASLEFHLDISNVTVTPSNVTLLIAGQPGRSALFTIDKDLDLNAIKAVPIPPPLDDQTNALVTTNKYPHPRVLPESFLKSSTNASSR